MGLWSTVSGVTRTVATYGKRTTRVIIAAPELDDDDNNDVGPGVADGGAAADAAEDDPFAAALDAESVLEEGGHAPASNDAVAAPVAEMAQLSVAEPPAPRPRADSTDCSSGQTAGGPATPRMRVRASALSDAAAPHSPIVESVRRKVRNAKSIEYERCSGGFLSGVLSPERFLTFCLQ